jgi:OmpA-OmpF porin, OOP family
MGNNRPSLLATSTLVVGIVGAAVFIIGLWQTGIIAIPKAPPKSSQLRLSQQRSNPQGILKLTLLGDTFSGYSTFRDAEFLSALQSSGIEINYANEFDQSLRAQNLGNGQADLMVTSLDQFLQHQPAGKIVGLLDTTAGADAVLLNTKQYSSLKSLLDLEALIKLENQKGRKLSITYATDTPSEYLSLVLDSKFEAFDRSDFDLKPVADASEAWALLQNPEENVAIAILWEPYITQARQQGYTAVLSSKDTPNAIIDVIVASDQLIQSNPDAISRLLSHYYRRIDANIKDATQLQKQVAKDGDLSMSDAANILSGIDFFTAAETQNWFQSGLFQQQILATANVLTTSQRLASAPTNPNSLYAEQFVTEAASNTQALVDLIKSDNPELADRLTGKGNTITPQLSDTQIQQASDIGNLQTRGQVAFEKDSAQLTGPGIETLNQLSNKLKEFSQDTVAVRIIGHTSLTGDENVNQALSQARAEVVLQYLKKANVQLNIVAEGKGSSRPLPNTNPADARNQRTEIRLVRID